MNTSVIKPFIQNANNIYICNSATNRKALFFFKLIQPRNISLLLLVFFFFGKSPESHSQDINTLTLHSFTIEVNGNPLIHDTTIRVQLIPEIPKEITIFTYNNLKYMGVFTYSRSKNRLKLKRKFYAVKGLEKPIASKTKKDVQYIKVSIPKKFTGKSSEHLVLDKEKLESVFVSFNYQFIYH